jgi:hypothetical protein
MISTARKEQTEAAIIEAFADEPYPGDEALTLPPQDWRTEEIQGDFKGRHWRDVPPELLNKQGSWLQVFSPAGRRFYLPAFMLLTLNQLLEKGSFHWVLFALDPPEQMGWFEREYGAYTPAQKKAIRLFLEYVRDEPEDLRSDRPVAQDALARYWASEDDAPPKVAEPARKAHAQQAIQEAFAEVPYPGDDGIGYNLSDWDGQKVNRDFKGYHWREVPRNVLVYHHYNLCFFSPRGRQFYLSTYLLAGLDEFVDIADTTIYYLSSLDDLRYVEQQHGFYTPAQKHAVCLFLEYVRDEMPHVSLGDLAQRALDVYWGRGAP